MIFIYNLLNDNFMTRNIYENAHDHAIYSSHYKLNQDHIPIYEKKKFNFFHKNSKWNEHL